MSLFLEETSEKLGKLWVTCYGAGLVVWFGYSDCGSLADQGSSISGSLLELIFDDCKGSTTLTRL